MEGKVAVLGNADFVMPFSALGVSTFAAGEQIEQVRKAAKEIIEGRYTLIVVAENIAPAAEEIFAAEHYSVSPCIVVVPFTTEPQGFATSALGEVLKMATGINLLQTTE